MNTVTIQGLVATTPRHIITQDGLPITSFRIASSQRKFDEASNVWVDGDTNWLTVTAFHQLAINVSESIFKGERIVVTGNLKVRDWDNGDRAGTIVELEAITMGHDLTWGLSTFNRTVLVQEHRNEPAPDVSPAPHNCNCGRCNRRNS